MLKQQNDDAEEASAVSSTSIVPTVNDNEAKTV